MPLEKNRNFNICFTLRERTHERLLNSHININYKRQKQKISFPKDYLNVEDEKKGKQRKNGMHTRAPRVFNVMCSLVLIIYKSESVLSGTPVSPC